MGLIEEGVHMPAKNNCQRKFRQLTDRQCHFSIRKLSVGVVSLAIGMIFYLSGPSHLVLAAEEADQDIIPAQVNPHDQNLNSEGVNIVSAEKDMEDVSPKEKLSPALGLGSEAISPTPNKEESLTFKKDEEIKVGTSENHKVVTDEKVEKQRFLNVASGRQARAAAEEKYYYDGDIAYDKDQVDEQGRHTIAVGLSPEGKQNVRQKGYVLSFPEGVTEIRYEKNKENITFNDANIQNIIFPKTLRKIGDGERLARYNADSVREIGVFSKNWIKSISFQEGLEEIGFGAFEMNDLTQVEIPATVKIIKDRAFAKNGIKELIFKGDLQAIQIGEGDNRDVFGEQTWGSSNNRRMGFPGNARIYYKEPARFEFLSIRDKNGPVQLNNFKVLTQEINGLWPVTPPSATHPQYQHQFEEDIENIRGKDKEEAPKFKLETQEVGHLAVSVLDYRDKRKSHNQFWVIASLPAFAGAESEAHPFIYGRFNLMYYPGYTITLISRPGEENDERAEVNLMPAFDSWCSSSWNYCPYLPNFKPEWPGHEFLGWYDENDERWDIENNKEVTRDMVLKGKWQANSIDIKYEFMSATENKTLPEDVRHLTPLTEKAMPGELFIPKKPEKDIVKTTDGLWSFLGYQLEGAFIPEDGIILSENEDNIIGLWSFSPSQTLIHEVPHLVIKDIAIRKGESLDWHDLIVEATSPTEGDLRKQVKLIDQGGFDPNIAGSYTLTFQVEDRLGAKVTRTGTVTVHETLTPLNEAPQLIVSDQVIMKGEALDLMSLIEKAEDKEDGDLRSQVKILDRGGFDPNVAGTYQITFQLTDSQGACVTKQVQVQVKEGLASLHEVPHLVIKDIAIRKGESLDWHDLIVEATSPTEGDLRKQVKLIAQGGFDPNIAGSYTLIFEVEDHLGAKVTRMGTVTVHETLSPLNEAPQLIVSDQVIMKGEALDLMSLIEKAEDKEDGDLRSQVKILDRGGFDPNVAGTYQITFQLTDSQGACVTKQAQVQVKEANEPSGGKDKPNSEIKSDSNLVVPHHPSSKPTEKLPAKALVTSLPQTSMKENLPAVSLGLAFLSLGLCFCIENKRSKKIKQRES